MVEKFIEYVMNAANYLSTVYVSPIMSIQITCEDGYNTTIEFQDGKTYEINVTTNVTSKVR